jgi:general secretion pathway protein G
VSPPTEPTATALRRAGFTLIEILVVVTVVAILASLVSPMIFRNVGDAQRSAARAQIELLGLALDSYRLDNDAYPTTAQGLRALELQPEIDPVPRRWRGPYLRKHVPADPWGNAYYYVSPGVENAAEYDLLSYGRDGRPGGTEEDRDVRSWESSDR